jgi:hypothetical protein
MKEGYRGDTYQQKLKREEENIILYANTHQLLNIKGTLEIMS